MPQRENCFRTENKHDRKKDSKFEIGDLIKYETGFPASGKLDIRWHPPRNFVIFDKRQLEDKQGKYWVYDIFYADNNQVQTNIRLTDSNSVLIHKFTKVA